MEEGFIRAKVVSARDLIEVGDPHAIRERGHLRTVGKHYELQDGDVLEFLFSGS